MRKSFNPMIYKGQESDDEQYTSLDMIAKRYSGYSQNKTQEKNLMAQNEKLRKLDEKIDIDNGIQVRQTVDLTLQQKDTDEQCNNQKEENILNPTKVKTEKIQKKRRRRRGKKRGYGAIDNFVQKVVPKSMVNYQINKQKQHTLGYHQQKAYEQNKQQSISHQIRQKKQKQSKSMNETQSQTERYNFNQCFKQEDDKRVQKLTLKDFSLMDKFLKLLQMKKQDITVQFEGKFNLNIKT